METMTADPFPIGSAEWADWWERQHGRLNLDAVTLANRDAARSREHVPSLLDEIEETLDGIDARGTTLGDTNRIRELVEKLRALVN